MNRDYRLQYNDDLRWHRVELHNVERLANWDKLVWQVAWIVVNVEYGRVSDLKQLESVIKPERQITLLGIEGTRIKAQWTNRMMVTIEDMEFVDKDADRKEQMERKERDYIYAARRQANMVPIGGFAGAGIVQNVQNVQNVQVQWNFIAAAAPLPFVNVYGEDQQGAAVVDNGAALHNAPLPNPEQFEFHMEQDAWVEIPPPPRRR